MKLYYSPLACSLASRIALYEAGAETTFVEVDPLTKTTSDGADFRTINPLGLVPTVLMEEGGSLTENVAILQYIAERFPDASLAPLEYPLLRDCELRLVFYHRHPPGCRSNNGREQSGEARGPFLPAERRAVSSLRKDESRHARTDFSQHCVHRIGGHRIAGDAPSQWLRAQPAHVPGRCRGGSGHRRRRGRRLRDREAEGSSRTAQRDVGRGERCCQPRALAANQAASHRSCHSGLRTGSSSTPEQWRRTAIPQQDRQRHARSTSQPPGRGRARLLGSADSRTGYPGSRGLRADQDGWHAQAPATARNPFGQSDRSGVFAIRGPSGPGTGQRGAGGRCRRFWGASQLIGTAVAAGGLGVPFNATNPYLKLTTSNFGVATFGLPHIQSYIPLAACKEIRANYWQKWFVHRTLRPEAYGGLVHNRLAERVDYPLHDDVLRSEAVARTFKKQGTYLLSGAYPEAAPNHSSYPGGASAAAAVSATILKAFYDEDFVIPDPVQPDPKDPSKLIPYVGPALTVGGELNKLAANIGQGRNWAGIHFRSDAASSLPHSEEVAIGLLQDEKLTFHEPFQGFQFTRFDGTRVRI